MGNRILLSRVISAAFILLLLSGCGAPATSNPTGLLPTFSSPHTEVPSGLTLAPTAKLTPLSRANIELSSDGLTPKNLIVQVGSQVTLNVKNSLKATYSCHLRDVNTVKKYPTQVFWTLDNITAGTTTTGSFTAPSKPASYELGCGVSPYPANGITQDTMIATLDVK